jgi:hypothetical protein
MIELSDVTAVVDICLLTASNFTGKKVATVDTSDIVLRGSNKIYPWARKEDYITKDKILRLLRMQMDCRPLHLQTLWHPIDSH